ncbi:hypothetical protein GX865_00765, partial [Candidatus Saccharibacteria bacterium]|nr:hypothetical protein [Candidatus Saccharibacteria bacterium]
MNRFNKQEKIKNKQESFRQNTAKLAGVFGHMSPLYKQRRRYGYSHNEAISASLSHYGDHAKIPEKDRNMLHLLSKLNEFILAQNEINEMNRDNSRLSTREKQRINNLKNNFLIPFNHTLKEVINDNPNVGFGEFTGSLVRNYIYLYSKDNELGVGRGQEAQFALHAVEQATNGMRHELATETMLDAAGVEYSYDTSIDDDRYGTDLYVKIDNTWYGIDIKASNLGEKAARDKFRGSMAISTGLNVSDFNG